MKRFFGRLLVLMGILVYPVFGWTGIPVALIVQGVEMMEGESWD